MVLVVVYFFGWMLITPMKVTAFQQACLPCVNKPGLQVVTVLVSYIK